jgi:hypothetical protein
VTRYGEIFQGAWARSAEAAVLVSGPDYPKRSRPKASQKESGQCPFRNWPKKRAKHVCVLLGDKTTTVYAPRVTSTFFIGILIFDLVRSDGPAITAQTRLSEVLTSG